MLSFRTRTYILLCVILVGLLYLVALSGIVPLFVLYFLAAYVIFVVSTFFYLGGLLFKFLPDAMRERHAKKPLRYFGLLLIPVFVFAGAILFSKSFAPHQRGIAHVLGIAGIMIFSVFLLWSLIKGPRLKTLVSGLIFFSIYLVLVTVWASTMKKVSTDPSLEELAALPYVAFAPAEKTPEKGGVTRHDAGRASPGINLYAPNHLAKAFLIDMNGKVLHQWVNRNEWEMWAHVALNGDGDLLAIYKDKRLTRLSWDSSVRWRHKGRFHHDARFAKNGDVYALRRNDEIVFHYFLPVPILNDYVIIFSSDGKMKKEYPLFDYLKRYVAPTKIFRIYLHLFQPKPLLRLARAVTTRNTILFSQKSPFDLFHTNSVELVEAAHRMFDRGDLLLSMRNLSLVAVLNPASGKIIWDMNRLTMQHQPSFLPNGNILVFDNGLPSTNSRIVEIDFQTKRIVWEYKAPDFYAYNRGGTQRLPNGNTLITESPDARAFEVTPEGKIVWEFYTPQVRRGKRGVIYRIMRYSEADQFSCLRGFFSSSADSASAAVVK